MTDLSTLEQEIFSGFANIKSKTELENFKIEILGKKGKLSKLFQDLATIEKDKKKEFASEINILKSKVLDKFQNLTNQFDQEELEKKLQDQTVDVTLPGTNRPQGKVHPVSQVIDELTSIFAELGFS